MSPLLTVMLCLAIFAMFTAAAGNMALDRIRATSRTEYQQRANYGCEAGFVLATEFLEKAILYDNANNRLSANNVNVANFNTAHTNIPLENDKQTAVTVRITSNLTPPGNTPASVLGPDGVTIEPGQVYIQTLARVGPNLSPATSRHLGGFGSLGTQNFPYFIMAEEQIKLTGVNSTSSASKTTTEAGPLPTYWEFWKLEIEWHGFPPRPRVVKKPNGPPFPPGYVRLLSNGRQQAVVLNNTRLDGPVSVGAGSNITAALQSTASTTVGAAQVVNSPVFITKYKPPTDPANVTATYNGGGTKTVSTDEFYRSLTMNGGKLVLRCTQPGTNNFYFSDSLVLNNCNVTVTPAGNPSTRAKVYVGKTLTMNHAQVNDGKGVWKEGDAWGNNKVFEIANWSYTLSFLGVGGGGSPSTLNGQCVMNITNSNVWALMSGSASVITMNGGCFGGAIKCRKIDVTGTNMYYDVAVNIPEVAETLWGRVSWTMQGVTDYGESLYADALADPIGVGAGPAGAMPAGPGAIAVGAICATSSNMGVNSGAAIAAPSAGSIGCGASAAGAAVASANSPSWFAALILGQ